MDLDTVNFNIYGTTNTDLYHDIWFLSEKNRPPNRFISRLETAFVETASMILSDSPLIITNAKGKKPRVGEISRGVFFCSSDGFSFGKYVLVNDLFWEKCMKDMSFIGSVEKMGDVIMGGSEIIRVWEDKFSLHCIHVYPDK